MQNLQIIIFGITGDLAKRKLLPALYHLVEADSLPENTQIIGLSRRVVKSQDLIEDMSMFLTEPAESDLLKKLSSMINIRKLDVSDPEDYSDLLGYLKSNSKPDSQRIYYLSIPAQAFPEIVDGLGQSGHNEAFKNEIDLPRILIEKPFGHDTKSAKQLINVTKRNFKERQIFRIDHYLAKETAQNILTFRFKNPLFETMWNSRYIESIRVSAMETIGIEGRGNFYDQTGALRDIVQSHLLQVLALATMERPMNFQSAELHRSKLRLLDSITPISKNQIAERVTRGQYDGYRQEIDDDYSTTETFARINLTINNEQWRKTKITLESGKAMHGKYTQITVKFRPTDDAAGPNRLIFRLQPNEGITIKLQAKRPGTTNDTKAVSMDFDYERSFNDRQAEAYERVIIDAIRGDRSLFASSKEVMSSWLIVQPILDFWQLGSSDLVIYPSGSSPENF